jgi:poly-gamma-glutamate synthesis protein (capsule biosynthesis protein)
MAWIAAVGDIMLDRGAQDAILSGEGGAERVFGDLLPILRNADFLVGNLEGAATEGGERADKLYTFRFRPSAVPRLKDAGFDYLALSNNHSFDYGQRGFLDGLKALRGAGIGFSGAGVRVAEALEPFRASAHGQALSLVAFGAFRPEQPAASISASSSNPGMLLKEGGLRAIRASSGPGAVDIAVVHAGTEYADAPDENIRGLYRECVDDGADIVLGSHPHVLQGAEAYRGGLIAYSLGNFVFRGMEKQPNATDTMILLIGVMDGRVAAMEPVFAKIGADGPRLAPDSSGERFYGLCRALAASSGRSEAFAVPTRASSGAPASPRPRME